MTMEHHASFCIACLTRALPGPFSPLLSVLSSTAHTVPLISHFPSRLCFQLDRVQDDARFSCDLYYRTGYSYP